VVRVELAVVRDLRAARAPAGSDELAAFETDTLAGLVLARAAAGLADSTIAGEVIHLDQVRAWLGRPLWTMQPADADAYFGQVLRGAARGTRLARAQALKTYFLFLELRHKAEIHQMTGHVVACPVDEVNRPRGGQDAALQIPSSQAQRGAHRGWTVPAARRRPGPSRTPAGTGAPRSPCRRKSRLTCGERANDEVEPVAGRRPPRHLDGE
jgi:hypothetical protein